VLDLDDNGVGPEVARAIADQLGNRLAANPGVRLVERRRMAQLLGEQQFQHSGRTDPGSAVRLARILNVNKVVLGAVAKLGTTMTITAQLVDVETAAIDGIREVQCRACALEDLSDAVAEMSETLVAPGSELSDLPEPPAIEIESPGDGASVNGTTVTLKGHVKYSRPLAGIELIVNGKPYPATRSLSAPATGKMTRLPGEQSEFSFVQSVRLDQPTNVIAVRAVGGDGNDDLRHVAVRRVSGPRPAAPSELVAGPPPLGLGELRDALASRIPNARIGALVTQFGVDFTLTPEVRQSLRERGADAALLEKIARARR
jgi:hypothetical protein